MTSLPGSVTTKEGNGERVDSLGDEAFLEDRGPVTRIPSGYLTIDSPRGGMEATTELAPFALARVKWSS